MLPGPEHRLVASSNRASRPSQRRTTPLRSVENKLKLKSPKLFSAEGIGSHPSNTANTRPIMSNFTLNNNPIPEIGVKIRTEPFTDHYTVESEIGRGKFAVVKKCRNQHNGLEYAAKFLRKRRKGKDCRAEFLHEVGMLEMALPHPRLVDLVEVFETTSELIIITEYAAGGELFQQVVREEKFCEKDVIYMMRQILEGLQFLHNQCIVHMDVKPQNILLTREMPYGDIKICDLGLARLVNVGEELREIIGTPDYVAPEVLQYEPIHLATDMWSVGVLTYVLLTGISPFAGDTKQETFCNIGQAEVDFPEDLFEDISKEAIQFMEALLVREPEKRMSARESLSHCWLCQGDTTKLPSGHSPFGSPVGCRRALTPSPDGFLNSEPSKKCKCTGKEVVNGKSDSEKENDLLGNDLESQNCTECTPPCNSKRGHLDAAEDNARREHERMNENLLSRRNDVRRSLQTVNTDKTPPKFGKPRFLKNPLS